MGRKHVGSVARGVAFFSGTMFALNAARAGVLGAWDGTIWWVDFRPLPEWVGVLVSAVAAGVLLALAVKPRVSGARRW